MKEFPKNLVCFSHLRWDFVYQRPQHLMTRLSRTLNVLYVEEPVFDAADTDYYTPVSRSETLRTIVPHLQPGLSQAEITLRLKSLLQTVLRNETQGSYSFWYYTPMAYEFTSSFSPVLTVYDCMDELSAFDFAPPQLREMEQRLLAQADLVFTGGHTLYEAKKGQHANIHPFPSSIEKRHFAKARKALAAPPDQARIKGIKIGFYGVIDERFDIGLIGAIAALRPDWNLILVGPVVKIDPATLPQEPNIHYLGQRSYEELPAYLSGWDVALIPFLLNESTRFISPTKTPEYLAAGKPVVSTPITDVVNPYGLKNLVSIGVTASEFVGHIDTILANANRSEWLARTDAFLAGNSWDATYASMLGLMQKAFIDANRISIAS